MEEELYTVEEAARRLKTTQRTVRDWLNAGKLRGLRAGQQWRVPASALQEFLQQPRRSEPDPLAQLDDAIAEEGECTRDSEKDQHQRDTQGREWIPPTPYEGPGDETV